MNNADFIQNAQALLDLDKDGALVPHGIGGHARSLLEYAIGALAAQPVAREPMIRHALEALDDLEASARGDEPFNHSAAPLIRHALEAALASTPAAPAEPVAHRQGIQMSKVIRRVRATIEYDIEVDEDYSSKEHIEFYRNEGTYCWGNFPKELQAVSDQMEKKGTCLCSLTARTKFEVIEASPTAADPGAQSAKVGLSDEQIDALPFEMDYDTFVRGDDDFKADLRAYARSVIAASQPPTTGEPS